MELDEAIKVANAFAASDADDLTHLAPNVFERVQVACLALVAAAEAGRWRPIEEHRAGEVLVANHHERDLAWKDSDGDWLSSTDQHSDPIRFTPTHFIDVFGFPLPPAPEA